MGLVDPGQFSQLVFTLVLTGTGTPTPNAGTVFYNARYTMFDSALGNQTNYPYGNTD